jgi:hypothetical protein
MVWSSLFKEEGFNRNLFCTSHCYWNLHSDAFICNKRLHFLCAHGSSVVIDCASDHWIGRTNTRVEIFIHARGPYVFQPPDCAFVGAWLGGRIYDATNDYSMMWWAAIAFGLLVTIRHLPIEEETGTLARAESHSQR